MSHYPLSSLRAASRSLQEAATWLTRTIESMDKELGTHNFSKKKQAAIRAQTAQRVNMKSKLSEMLEELKEPIL